jgi:hypothetical protein
MEQIRKKIAEQDFLRVVCIGDAQTAQPEVAPRWSDWVYRSLLERYEAPRSWRLQVLNTASAGATPKHVATYFSHYIGQFKPDLVIASFGATAATSLYSESEFIPEFEALEASIARAGIQLALWTPCNIAGGIAKDHLQGIARYFIQEAVDNGYAIANVQQAFEEYELSKLYEANDSSTAGRLNSIGSYLVAKTIVSELFSLPMLSNGAGSFSLPNLDQSKKWG